MLPAPITTSRLVLRLPADSDQAALRPLYDDPLALRHIGTERAWTEQAVRRFHESRMTAHARYGYTLYTVTRKSDGAVVGVCGLCPDEDARPEISAAVLSRFWGRRYAAEALLAVMAAVKDDPAIEEVNARMEADHPQLPYYESTLLRPHGFVFERTSPHPGSGKRLNRYRWTRTPAIGDRAD
ncbi:GNAT family N-acetyltransferase [Spirillospora sp. NPDC127200]